MRTYHFDVKYLPWEKWTKKWHACGSRTPGDELADQGDGTTRAKVGTKDRDCDDNYKYNDNDDNTVNDIKGDPQGGGCGKSR